MREVLSLGQRRLRDIGLESEIDDLNSMYI